MIRNVHIKILKPGIRPKTFTHSAGRGGSFMKPAIQGILKLYAESLEADYPNDEFRCVQIGPGRFNLIYAGSRPLLA